MRIIVIDGESSVGFVDCHVVIVIKITVRAAIDIDTERVLVIGTGATIGSARFLSSTDVVDTALVAAL